MNFFFLFYNWYYYFLFRLTNSLKVKLSMLQEFLITDYKSVIGYKLRLFTGAHRVVLGVFKKTKNLQLILR